ncbi:hypothetical protein SAMN02910292_02638 [Lachnospiraceae bacterium XBB2008]|nr:hypothetical protein SAMN02910292_02638 [Lachnospiraceae bacterium XBB2008]
MSKKKKKKQISSESKTCFYFAIGFLVVGILCIIFGKTLYHTDDMVSLDDVITGKTATITSVEKRERTLSREDEELERKKGYTEDEIRWEYYVVYTVKDGGNEYTYSDTARFRSDGTHIPKVGDTEVINYAIKDGKFIPHPETQGTNGAVIGGWFLVILSVLAAGVGLFLRK